MGRVSWAKSRSKWKDQITVDGKKRHLGSFDAEEEAAKAYRDAQAVVGQGRPIPAYAPRVLAGVTSQHRGVHWDKSRSKWKAQIQVGGKQRHLGYFAAEEEAAKAYRDAEVPLD
jgi:hypothetical protein